ncbi:MAG: 8-hydroxy-5-deazaflavin:NADPH oxidoreductase [Solirubrobacterales bacterium]|nr:8-hydroxy-5-deazaflavin:NADPH oxidoreductase [Solirubrobacterales bacterium]
MRIGIVGAGHIGGNCARQVAKGGHEVKLSGRDPSKLEPLAAEIGDASSVGTPVEAAEFGEVVVLSVPWDGIDDAIAAAGGLDGKIVIDTTNFYGGNSPPAEGETQAQHNAARMPGARYTKSFNTLTSGFQAEAAFRPEAERVVQWVCGDDQEAKRIVMDLIADAGYAPVDLGGTADAAVMEAPGGPGAVYGEEYRLPDGGKVVEAVKAGKEIPPTPTYS